jgi:hypothetical protein
MMLECGFYPLLPDSPVPISPLEHTSVQFSFGIQLDSAMSPQITPLSSARITY